MMIHHVHPGECPRLHVVVVVVVAVLVLVVTVVVVVVVVVAVLVVVVVVVVVLNGFTFALVTNRSAKTQRRTKDV